MVGVPAVLRHATITACVADLPCATTRVREPLRTQGLQYVALPTDSRWSELDGTSVHVSVRTEHGRWQGAGTFEYTPSDGSPCDCASLVTRISMQATSPLG